MRQSRANGGDVPPQVAAPDSLEPMSSNSRAHAHAQVQIRTGKHTQIRIQTARAFTRLVASRLAGVGE